MSAQASVRPLLGCSGGAAVPKPLPLSAALCARTSPPAAAVSAAAPNAATDVPPEQLWVPQMQPRDSYTAAGDFFPYARPPPTGFQRWLEYAQPRECLLGRYDRMEADLAAFRYAHDSISPLGRQQQYGDLALCLGVTGLGWQRPASRFCQFCAAWVYLPYHIYRAWVCTAQLLVLQGPWGPYAEDVTRAALARAAALTATVFFHIRDGQVSCTSLYQCFTH